MAGIAWFVPLENSFTLNKVARDKSSILAYKELIINGALKININGCIITNSTSYIDIEAENELYNKFVLCQHIMVYTGEENTLNENISNNNLFYFAYINNIEISNFTSKTGNNIYRIYFTVDYWNTLLLKSEEDEIFNNIYGNVQLAHVDDLKVLDVDGVPYVFPQLAHTTTLQEYQVEHVSTKRIILTTHPNTEYPSSTYPNKTPLFLYVLSTKPYFEGLTEHLNVVSSGIINMPRKPISTSLYMYFGVLVGNYITEITGNYTFNNSTTKTETIKALKDYDIFTDSSIVGMFISSICPYPVYSDDNKSITFITQGNDDELSDKPITKEFSTRSGVNFKLFMMYPEQKPVVVGASDMPEDYFPLSAGYPQASIPFNFISTAWERKVRYGGFFSGINSYNYYLKHISKQYFPPYRNVMLGNGNDGILLDTGFMYSPLTFLISYNGNGTGYVVYNTSITLEEDSIYQTFIDTGLYQINAVIDDITRTTAFFSGSKAFLNIGFSLAGAIATPSTGSIQEISNANIGFYETAVSNYKMLRDGENGTKLQPSATVNIIKPVGISVSEPYSSEIYTLQLKMALYGYNTNKQPSTILKEHKRRYFNYIKTSNCQFNLPVNEIAKTQIENMFNRGVWLLSEYTIRRGNGFSLEVANFPESIYGYSDDTYEPPQNPNNPPIQT